MNVAQETLGLRRGSFSLPLSLLMSAFALLIPPEHLTMLLRRRTERSPTARAFPSIHCPRLSSFAKLIWRHDDKPLLKAGKLAYQEEFGKAIGPALNELKWNARTRSFGVQFEPRYIFRAGRLDQ